VRRSSIGRSFFGLGLTNALYMFGKTAGHSVVGKAPDAARVLLRTEQETAGD
jgi:hypothetical protein